MLRLELYSNIETLGAKIFCLVFLPFKKFWSAFIEGETPVPIPNTAVKPLRADGSVFVRTCESRSVLL